MLEYNYLQRLKEKNIKSACKVQIFFVYVSKKLYLCKRKACDIIMKDEIVLYQPNDTIQLEVRVQDDTVWLNRNQMAVLFDRDVKTIGKHINNALREELAPVVANFAITQKSIQGGANFATPYAERNQVVAKFATPYEHGSHKGQIQIQQVEYYSLDVILSVGYRVKSSRGIEFRRWANSVLREYILRGHAINQRILAVEERVDNRLIAQERRLEAVEEKIDFFVRTSLPPVEQVFFEGEFFEARVLLEQIIKTATKRVIIIDGYIDAATFDMLDVRAKGVTADIYSDNEYKSLRDAHNASKGKQPINTHKWSKSSHDRWLIIDDSLYHCGHSLKDMGKKLSAIMSMDLNPEVVLNEVKQPTVA